MYDTAPPRMRTPHARRPLIPDRDFYLSLTRHDVLLPHALSVRRSLLMDSATAGGVRRATPSMQAVIEAR